MEIFRILIMPPEEIAMRKARLTEHQIIAALKCVEARRTIRPLFLKPAITTGRQSMAGCKRLILKLEDENRRLKQMFSDLSLKNRALKDVIEKALKPAIKRALVNYLKDMFSMSVRQVCRTLSLSITVSFSSPR